MRGIEGDNPRKISFYSTIERNTKNGEFWDDWGKPLLMRKIADYIEIRSAGKDDIFFTEDDLTIKTKKRPRS